jgi:hypothetical protein
LYLERVPSLEVTVHQNDNNERYFLIIAGTSTNFKCGPYEIEGIDLAWDY